jgi:hypothetical protein
MFNIIISVLIFVILSTQSLNGGTLTLMLYGQNSGQWEVLVNTVINIQIS